MGEEEDEEEEQPEELEVTSPIREDSEEDQASANAGEEEEDEISISDIRCACKREVVETFMLTCHVCRCHMHLACYGLQSEDDARLQVVLCYTCAKNPEAKDILEQLGCFVNVDLNEQQAQELCLLRYSLCVAAILETAVGADDIIEHLGVDSKMANKLMKRMVTEGYVGKLPPRSKSKKHAVNLQQIQEVGLSTYFVTSISLSQEDQEEAEKEVDITQSSSVAAEAAIIESTRRLSLRNNNSVVNNNTPLASANRASRSREIGASGSVSVMDSAKQHPNIKRPLEMGNASTPIGRLSGHETPLGVPKAKAKSSTAAASNKKGHKSRGGK